MGSHYHVPPPPMDSCGLREGGLPFLREVMVGDTLMRFTGTPEGAALGHMHGPLYYLPTSPIEFLPWTFVLIPPLISSLRKTKHNSYLGWLIGPFLLLSVAIIATPAGITNVHLSMLK